MKERNVRKGVKYTLNADGRFIIENYNKSKPFSNFFPGIAGLCGIPMWVFYVNRGQCISSFGIESKVVICALIVFFPILVNTIAGVKAIDKNLSRLFKILGAGRFQTFLKLEIPSILPILFVGFKIGITLAVIGAVVGEFVGANAGLGYLTIYASGLMDTPTVFAALIQLALLGITLYAIICLLERLLIPWYILETKIGKTVTNTNKGRHQ